VGFGLNFFLKILRISVLLVQKKVSIESKKRRDV
jgi:hypothetical protein